MYPLVSVEQAISLCTDPDKLVYVEESPEYPGNLLFQTTNDVDFLYQWKDWISRYMCLSELFMLRNFINELTIAGYQVFFAPSAGYILDRYDCWEEPLAIDNFNCPGGGQLYPYQTFSLNRALELSLNEKAQDRMFFAGWCTGSGKSLFACAGTQELFNRDQIDVALVFTLMKMKHNLAYASKASYAQTTNLDWVIREGMPKDRRQHYADKHQVYVLNYEKLWADYDDLAELTEGKRVLWIFDEVQKVLTTYASTSRKTKTRKHLDKLVRGSEAIVWPMSASVVGSNPLRYRDVFNLAGTDKGNPLGSKTEFEQRYTTKITHHQIGWNNEITYYQWNLAKLHEVRHRVSVRTQSARKTDPGVREFFKANSIEPVPIQMSKEDRKLYVAVQNEAYAMHKDDPKESLMGHYRLLRYICNTPVTLAHTGDQKGQAIAAAHPKLVNNNNCAKLEYFLDHVESIAQEQEKVIAFTQWTNLSLHLISPELDKRGIKHVLHWGVGQKNAESVAAQHIFKTDPEITLFFSSDAGAHGLNLPEARYCINYECPYGFDLLMQRSERNNRADTQFDTTAYVYITEDTVEERIWEINEERRKLAAATLGTSETLNYGDRANKSEEANLSYLIFGE